MTNNMLTQTLKEMNDSDDIAYYSEKNRNWQPLTATLSPSIPGPICVIPILTHLGIMDKDGNINPVIDEAGLFACITVCNPKIGQEVAIKEILVSNLGLEFLKSMNEKRFLQEGGYLHA